MRDACPLAGSRRHYSLVDGGQVQAEQMPEAGLAKLSAEVIP